MFNFSTLRLDLIGGAAMPFFYLLSGFVMTLGYGQSNYSDEGGCCGDELPSDAAKKFDAKRFWRNRFARLAPVYYVTNLLFFPVVLVGMAPAGIDGMAGPHTVILSAFLSLFGINSWLYPFIDVGPPPNPVCWTITTMSFFYWVFPCALPRMQRMSTQQRSKWIVYAIALRPTLSLASLQTVPCEGARPLPI
jgi:peptidoglycan/LPS O-acetylase OafA/YrhL